jgi:neuronal PAS domain-containing protein 1/3
MKDGKSNTDETLHTVRIMKSSSIHALKLIFFAVLNKGQSMSDYWRMMNKHGGFVWAQLRATLTCNTKNAEDQHIVAIIYVLR